ncbi:cytochrome c-type biogenesis protein CcmE [Legionella beliardensis]|uniref:Cytochrome c-type biogenesis protein CcmE n=1 Tax=Legionella beliardensis TaxID=91822 RepID=A0A378I091_9GAMM|nr:cytochrome c maturation protein CcmE [Legionella beliardensis]STX28392.1 cytochrome c-type biogenesis protein CcmE [Legionella beliardensis]
MNAARRRKLTMVLFILLTVTAVLALIMYALRQNISLFYTPSQVGQGEAPQSKPIRIGGMVVEKSIVRAADGLTVQFKLTDFKQTISVSYRGILPDLFREGQGIVALGTVLDKEHFKATEVLAKHDANYMPPEVKNALAQQQQQGGKTG